MIELLSPVGDLECLKAAVQNGANAVYFGAKSFGARAFANNFDDASLNEAINYAKIRNVKTHLTLNTLIKENELNEALNIAKKAYEYGIDAIIVQDLGLASILIKEFPDLDIHASTQLTAHNLESANFFKELGFKRVVLSRELSLDEINYICENTDIEIEVFAHGALCISYSGQCLFSSMVGGRSGNRGKCAQPCRLPYELLENKTKKLDKGYLLSPRDLCSLDLLPQLIKSGITSLKIEGRMKNPEYVAIVTQIYRKYIDLALNSNKQFKVDPIDKKALMQVYNRGGFSHGHLENKKNQDLIFKEKPNNMGIYLGSISKYNKTKGHISCKLENNVSVGDSISFENENSKYLVSELIEKNQNIKDAFPMQNVTLGRMKGNIKIGDKIYKVIDKSLSNSAKESFSKENTKNQLECKLQIKKDKKIFINISCPNFNTNINYTYDYIPQAAQNSAVTKDKIISQFSKTLDTEFEFTNFDIELDDNLFIPVSILNSIRRLGIELIREKIIKTFKKNHKDITLNHTPHSNSNSKPQIALLLNTLNTNFDYTLLKNIDKLYIPLKYFGNSKYSNIVSSLSKTFNIYIYMPTIIRKNYIDTTKNILNTSLKNFKIQGIVISHLSQLKLMPKDLNSLDIVGNYTLNIYNSYSNQILKDLNINTSTISPELDSEGILGIGKNIATELIVYGNIPVMNMNYCLLGKSNHCYNKCEKKCNSNSKYYIKDRMGLLFRVIPDNIQTITTIYNSKITSIEYKNFDVDFVRVDILDEDISAINKIINTILLGKKLNGSNYTNGNLSRKI